MSRASVKPASWNSRSVSWPIRTTGSAGYPGNAIDGIATSAPRSSSSPGMSADARLAISCGSIVCSVRSQVEGQKKTAPMTAPTTIVVTDSTSIGTKKLWSSSLVPSFVVPVRSKFAAAIWVPLAGSV